MSSVTSSSNEDSDDDELDCLPDMQFLQLSDHIDHIQVETSPIASALHPSPPPSPLRSSADRSLDNGPIVQPLTDLPYQPHHSQM